MKKQTVLLVALLLTSISATAYLPISAEPTLTPHEDPAGTQSALDVYSFLAEYATIFSLMSNQHYDNASQLSEQLSHISIPEDLSYIINRYNNLTQQLINVLNDLQGTLESASSLLDLNRLSEAEQALNHASVSVAKAQILLNDLKDATATVSQRLGVFSGAAQSGTQQAFNQLQGMLDKLSLLIDRYHTLLDEANLRAQEIEAQNLDRTSLTLLLNSSSCYVGSRISATGALTSKEGPLGNRQVKLYVDGVQAAEASTDNDGRYRISMQIPYKYADSVNIQCIYSPSGYDKSHYLAALSPIFNLKLLFLYTNLELLAPDVGYPGLAVTVAGKVTDSHGHGLVDRQVTGVIDGAKQFQVDSGQDGTFTAKFMISPQTTLGNHTLTLSVNAQNLYAPITRQKSLTVQKLATDLQVDAPTFIILPATIEVTGKARSPSGALEGATVQVEYANISRSIKTRDDGSFNLTLDVPLNTALAGSQELKIVAYPIEPWQAKAEITKSIFALNSVSTSVAFASTFSVFAVAYMRLTKNRGTEKAESGAKQATTAKAASDNRNGAATAPPSIRITRITGLRGQIVQYYTEALTAVQAATGIPLTHSMTLREYAQSTQQKIGVLSDDFRALTEYTERCLYGSREPQLAEINQAEKLSLNIRRNLNAGN